jgi:mannose-6-phosphate isomerase-like protein (cupin superfamily)
MSAKTKPAKPVNRYRRGDKGTRPWGEWRVIDIGEGFAVKRIVVSPGHRLSLQRHAGRDEHWFVVGGGGKTGLAAVLVSVSLSDVLAFSDHLSGALKNPKRARVN